MMNDSKYDVAQICINGHVVTSALERNPELGKKFCQKCGEPTISKCPNCGQSIQGLYFGGGMSFSPYVPPAFATTAGNHIRGWKLNSWSLKKLQIL